MTVRQYAAEYVTFLASAFTYGVKAHGWFLLAGVPLFLWWLRLDYVVGRRVRREPE